jgi:hypothetical protein
MKHRTAKFSRTQALVVVATISFAFGSLVLSQSSETIALAADTVPLADDAGGDSATGAVGRESACRTAKEAICKAQLKCQKVCPDCDVLHPTLADCMKGVGPWCTTTSIASERPMRQFVLDADFKRCLAATKVASKDANACHDLMDQEYPTDCTQLLWEVLARDYTPSPGLPCGPGYIQSGNKCLLTCSADAECRPRFEVCGNADQPGVCVPAQRKR